MKLKDLLIALVRDCEDIKELEVKNIVIINPTEIHNIKICIKDNVVSIKNAEEI